MPAYAGTATPLPVRCGVVRSAGTAPARARVPAARSATTLRAAVTGWHTVRMALHITDDPAADELLTNDPLALLIGMLLDQQVP